jgi:glucokinase
MAKYKIGIDLGGTNIAAGIVDENYKITVKGSIPTKPDRNPEEIIKDMGALCNDLISKAGLSADDIEYAGIASPGTANRDTGVVEYANNLPFVKFPIADILKKYVAVNKVHIENDANAAAKGEAIAGAAKGCRHAVMITLGTGLGGGIIIDKKVYSGFNFAGGELGHMVIEYNGRQCSCGRKGCWEAYASATGIGRMTREAMEKNPGSLLHKAAEDEGKISARTAFAASRMGDAVAQTVVDTYIKYLAAGLANMINVLQPEMVCIGGGVSNEGEPLMIPLSELTHREVYKGSDRKTVIRLAELGNNAGVIGAAMLGKGN